MPLALRTNRSAYALSRRLLYAASALSLVLPASAWAQSAQSGAPSASHSFAITAQPLETALREYMQQSGVQVGYESADVAGRTSAAVNGAFAAGEALSRLLSGTGLTYRFTASTAVRLEPAPSADAGAVQLGPVRVAADEDAGGTVPTPKTDQAATDRSRSYAARAATVAGKTAQGLREIPQSVTVVTRQRMDDQNLVSVEQALRQATGVTAIPYGDGTAYFQTRGYPSEVQFDGIPANNAIQYLGQYDLAMYDRIEVLRGPSGLLQGSGEPSGTINLVRKRPHNEFGWAGSLMGGSWNNVHGDLDVTGPLTASGAVRGRIVASGQDRDQFIDRSHERHGMLYGIVEADLDASTTFTLSGTLQDQKLAPFDYGPGLRVDGTAIKRRRSDFFGVDWAHSKILNREAYASLEHRFGNGWAAKASANYRHQRSKGAYGYVGYLVELDDSSEYALQSQDFRSEWFGADVNVGGPVEAFGRTHTLLFGANYAWQSNLNKSGYIGTTVDSIFDIDIPEQAIPFSFASAARSEQYGLYGQARLSLADPLTLVLGGRLTSYRSATRTGLAQTGAFTEAPDVNGHFTPSAGLVWDVTSAVTLYGSYASTFVPQSNLVFGGGTLKPRTGGQFEIGAKGAFLDGALNVSGALFTLTDRDRAYLDPDHPGTPAYYIAAGKVRSRGIELEVSGEPLPGWSLFAGYTYLDTKILAAATNEGKIFDTEEPKNTLKLWSAYRFGQRDAAGFQIGGGLRAQSKTSRGGPEQAAYAVVDGQVGYRLNGQWSATVTVSNIFDKTYYARLPSTFFSLYGEPRSFTVTLRKGF